MSTTRTTLSPWLAAALLACAPTPYEKAQRADSADGWAQFLREQPSAPQAAAVRRRLAELEFQHARRQNTVIAYKRFLEAHPASDRKADARVLLENLRFDAAAKVDSSLGWNEFLRDHPAGVHAAEARAKLEEADWREAVAAADSQALATFVARHPESKHRTEADRLVDDRLFAEARAAGPQALAAYLSRSAAGAHREEARGLLAAHEAQGRAWLGDWAGARRSAERIVDAAERARVQAIVDQAELDQVTAALDPKALEALAARSPALAAEARTRAKQLQAADRAGALKALAARMDPSFWARPQPELERVLSAADPRDRWIAAEELGLMGARSVDLLLDAAAGSRFARVRERAFSALQALYAGLPAATRDVELRGRLESLRKVAQSPILVLKIALIEELLGEVAAAAGDYQKSVRGDASDFFSLRRLVGLRAQRGEGFGTAVAARELALRVQQLVDQRAQEEGLSPLLLARTLCGARDQAQAAVAALAGLPPKAAQDFPEDLQAFQRRADEVLRLATARLADAEAEARVSDKGFKGCDDGDGLRERLAQGEADRLEVVGRLAARPEPLVRHALSLAARRDPSPKVREAAAAALGKRAAP